MNKKVLSFFVAAIVLGFVMYFLSKYSSVRMQFETDFYVVMIAMAVFTATYAVGINKSVNNLFQPLHIYAFFYLCICFLTPCFMMIAHEEDCHGVNVMNGCIPGTIYVILAFIAVR